MLMGVRVRSKAKNSITMSQIMTCGEPESNQFQTGDATVTSSI
jgi:hypothetical protein